MGSDMKSVPGPSAPRTPRRWRRWGVRALVLGVLLLISAECVLRWGVGLGDPPLYELDDTIEYLLVPNKTYHRFGNTFSVNQYSMRSSDFPPKKADPSELRVMVIGDSIVNAGAKINQKDIATERLRERLMKQTGRPVVVGNISAGSWGPMNQLAYVETFGLFGADVVILVLNGPDADDVPGLEGIGPQWPQSTPVLALQEVIENYGVRAIERISKQRLTPAPLHSADPQQDRAKSLAALRSLIDTAHQSGARVCVVQYLTKPEILSKNPSPGSMAIAEAVKAFGVPLLDTGGAFASAMTQGKDPFLPGDDVHASADGQGVLAGVLEHAVSQAAGAAPKVQ